MPGSSFVFLKMRFSRSLKMVFQKSEHNEEVDLMLEISNQPFSACCSVRKSPVSDDFRPN